MTEVQESRLYNIFKKLTVSIFSTQPYLAYKWATKRDKIICQWRFVVTWATIIIIIIILASSPSLMSVQEFANL